MSSFPYRQRKSRKSAKSARMSPSTSRRIALISGISLALSSGGVWAAQFGSPAWFAAQSKAVPVQNVQAPATDAASNNLSGRVVTPDQALVRAQRSVQNLSRAAEIIASAQSAQNAARQLALSGASTVPNGLQAGGLQVASGVGTDPSLWQNAALPTQTTEGSQTIVTVEQDATKAILTWDSFNVGRDTTLHFDQTRGTQSDGSNAWIALNRVLDTQAAPSQILGKIKAEGSVYLINRNGIVFGGASQVNTHSFLASSLALFSEDVATSNATFLDSGIEAVAGRASFILGGDINFTSQEEIDNWQAPGDIEILAGAQIVTGRNGYSLIAAPNVSNAGTILAQDGQAIVAAGVGIKLQRFELDSALAILGNNVWMPALAGNVTLNDSVHPRGLGTVENSGLIGASRGNVSVVGFEVKQSGIVQATTSVSRPGSIYIGAQDSRGGLIGPQAPALGGILDFGSNSLTTILPERDGETTTSGSAADLTFTAPAMILGGAQVTLHDDALVLAPGATVDLLGWGRRNPANNQEVAVERIEMGHRAVIDVAGLADVQLAMSANQVTIPRVGRNELADSPLQRDGILYTEEVSVDGRVSGTRGDGLAWFGSPLLNIGGYIENQPRKIDQLLTSGGTIDIVGRELLTRSDSLLNLDGGYVHYLGGRVETTRLLGVDGRVYDISQADPALLYTGIAGQYVRNYSRWNASRTYEDPLLGGKLGRYETAYIVGGSGGTLNLVMSGATLLDGEISAQAVSGRYQIAEAHPAEGGNFNFGMNSALAARAFSTIGSLPAGTHVVLARDTAPVADEYGMDDSASSLPGSDLAPTDPGNPLYWTTLSAESLNDAGFSNVALGSSLREVLVQEGADLTVQNGGSIVLKGARVEIYGNLTARSGEISATATGVWQSGLEAVAVPIDADTGLEARGDVVVGGTASLDASGEWVNDGFVDIDQRSGPAWIDGGKITLTARQRSINDESGASRDWSGSISLQAGATLDVSGGGYVLPNGELAVHDAVPLGKGGDIALLSYVRPPESPFAFAASSLPVNESVGRLDFAGARLLGYSLGGGGTLSLRALDIQIGGDPVNTDPRTLYLGADFFAGQGFGAYDLAAELDATIAADAQIHISQRNLIPDVHALVQAPTGADLYGGLYGELGVLDAYYRPATHFSLRAADFIGRGLAPNRSDITGTLLMAEGASLLLDPGASVRLGSRNQLTVLGSIVAPGGEIVLSADSTQDLGESAPPVADQILPEGYSTPSKSLWLGANASLDVSGVSLIDPLSTPLATTDGMRTPRNVRLLDGGTVTLSNDTGYVVVESGARIELSGTADRYDLIESGPVGIALTSQEVWSDAGTLTLAASSGLFFDGNIHAEGGAPAAAGGTLILRPTGGNSTGLVGAAGILFHESGSQLPDGLTPGDIVEAELAQPSGVLHFAVDRLIDSGIETLIAGTDPHHSGNHAPLPIGFAGDVSLALDRAILLNASSYVALSETALRLDEAGEGGTVRVLAPYVSISGNHFESIPTVNANLAAPSDASLSVEAGTIDLGGQFALENFRNAAFVSSGDIRFHTRADFAYFNSSTQPTPGQLLTAGNLTFTAAQLYPATNNAFAVVAAGAVDVATGLREATTITIAGNGAASSVPLSAGGSLLLDATHIEQRGTIRAPAGSIVLGVDDPNDTDTRASFGNLPLTATESVRLADSSLTSVSLDGRRVPYGTTVDQTNYQDQSNPRVTQYPDLTAPPEKQIAISGTKVALDPGATVDLEGGGELYAQEWIAGTGGSRDVLSRTNTVYSGNTKREVPLYADGRAVYAIVPGQSSGIAPYDPAFDTGDVHIGQSVYLSGMEGIPAGVYTLMPAQYATLPGAYRVVQDTGAIDTPASLNAKLPDGTLRMSGYFTDGLTGARDARNTSFLVQSREVWGQYSEYAITDMDDFFSDQAASQGTALPRLMRDAGRLALAATQSLSLGARLNTTAGEGGAGAQVDIASERIQIIGGDASARDGYLQIAASDLNSLGAASLLIGGTRSQTKQGVTIDAQTSSLVVSNDAGSALRGPEILLVTNGGGGAVEDGLYLESGSAIRAQGEIPASASVPIRIGREADAANNIAGVSGDGTLLRVSNGAPVLVDRRNVTGTGGLLQIGAGATLDGGAVLSLDATGDTRLDATAVLAARAIDANSSLVSIVANAADGAGLGGLVIGAQTLAQLSNSESITLRSRGDLNFVGAVDISLDDAALNLSAGRFVSDGNDVHLGARTLTLSNELNGSTSGTASGAGSSLGLSATTLQFGAGEARFAGFANVNASATQMITGEGTGTADFADATLTLTAPVLVGGEAANTTLKTTGNVHLVAGAGSVPDDLPIGGALSLVGGSIDGNAHFAAPAGRISLRATQGDVALDAGTVIDVSGIAKQFFDVTRYAGGGAILLSADHGDVRVAQGTTLDFAGHENGGNAGSLSVSAAEGSALLDGNLQGRAAAGQIGGSFSLDTGSAVVLDALADRLLAGGINGAIAVQTRSGNLELSADRTLTAQSVRLAADGGAGGIAATEGHVIIGGTIDASGRKGGEIELFGKSGVEVHGTLLANGSSADELGGTVKLYTSGVTDGTYNASYGYQNVTAAGSGRISIDSDAIIDVSGGSAGGLSGGKVHLRAPLLNDGDVNVSIVDGAQIRGAREVALEAYAVWSTTDSTTGNQHFDGIVDPAGWYDSQGNLLPGTFTTRTGVVLGGTGDLTRDYFSPTTPNADHVGFYQDTLADFVQQPGFTFEDRFAHVANFVAQPGVELQNPSPAINDGKISVLTNWNLGATDATNNFIYRYNGVAPFLTLRAENDVSMQASISDGFHQYWNDTLSAALTIWTRDDALAVFTSNGLAAARVNGANFQVFQPDTLTTGSPEEQSTYYEMYRAYTALFSAAQGQYGVRGNARLVAAAQAANQRGFSTGPNPANPAPTAPLTLQDYPAYLQAYVTYARAVLRNWNGANSVAIPHLQSPSPPPPGLMPLNVSRSANTPAPVASNYDRLPLHTATLIGGGSSYHIVAGADWDSSDPLAVRAASDAGDIVVDGHTIYTDAVSGRDVLLPTLLRTGTGSVELAAARDIRLDDSMAPAAIYSAGRPADATAVTNAVSLRTATSALAGYRAAFLITGRVNPESAGNISLTAGRDIVGNQQLYDVDGRITGIAGSYIGQYWWPWMQTGNTSDASSINFGAFGQGVMSIGGNIAVAAGRDIRELSVSLPTTWTLTPDVDGVQELTVYGGGDLSVTAGRDVLAGTYFVSKGEGALTAGSRIGSGFTLDTLYSINRLPISTPVAPILALQDASWQVGAAQGVDIGGIYNPSYVRRVEGLFSAADSQAYSTDSSISITSTSGDVALSTMILPAALFSYGRSQDSAGVTNAQPQIEDVLPASIDAVALNGSLSVEAGGLMFPSATGALSLIAAENLSLFSRRAIESANNSRLTMADIDAATLLPSPVRQLGISNSFSNPLTAMLPTRYEMANLHREATDPVRLYALDGDIVGGFTGRLGATVNSLTVRLPKAALIQAGRDVVDLDLRAQNHRDTDVTRVVAGRDIYYTPPNVRDTDDGLGYASVPGLHLEIAGPGVLDVVAGRNLGPLTSAPAQNTGIRSTGNLSNAGLPYDGADISVRFGVGPGMATDAFAARYLDPSQHQPDIPDYGDKLLAYMRAYFADHPEEGGAELTVTTAWQTFQQLPEYRRQLLVQEVFLDLLNRVGADYHDPLSAHFEQYARGYEAINTLFPAGLGYTANSLEGGTNGAEEPVMTGNLDMRGSTIQTRRGGNISILGPGGQVLVGSSSAPPVILDDLGNVQVGPSEQGILTMERGSIGIFSDLSVLLAQSRVFTEQGGDILMWSSNGDINAGKGAKTSSEKPPVIFDCDQDRYCRVDAGGQVTGAGIATLQTTPDAPAGDAVLVAPRGTVDAGDAGIRASGNLVIAAFSVANADNIQVQGETVGVPVSTVNVGALSSASSAAAAAQKSADELANQRPRERAASMITVEVVGLGKPEEKKK
ncbi:filamentous hemagglutinin family protein [Steroidobacter flavus]|uniref:Filamentous hemagglutinin family protein n=1 Tax=Steroidobacter flavus TaxID=1842136 RepID=A0ABV8T254_9GAMM